MRMNSYVYIDLYRKSLVIGQEMYSIQMYEGIEFLNTLSSSFNSSSNFCPHILVPPFPPPKINYVIIKYYSVKKIIITYTSSVLRSL